MAKLWAAWLSAAARQGRRSCQDCHRRLQAISSVSRSQVLTAAPGVALIGLDLLKKSLNLYLSLNVDLIRSQVCQHWCPCGNANAQTQPTKLSRRNIPPAAGHVTCIFWACSHLPESCVFTESESEMLSIIQPVKKKKSLHQSNSAENYAAVAPPTPQPPLRKMNSLHLNLQTYRTLILPRLYCFVF